MRNLIQYPVTKEEIIGCLKEFVKEVDPETTGLYGDMRPILLAEAVDIVDQMYASYKIFSTWKRTADLK